MELVKMDPQGRLLVDDTAYTDWVVLNWRQCHLILPSCKSYRATQIQKAAEDSMEQRSKGPQGPPGPVGVRGAKSAAGQECPRGADLEWPGAN